MTITYEEARDAVFLIQQFLEQHRALFERPTEKQVKFAQDLAKQRGIQAPDFSKMSKSELSRWIDDHLKGKRG